MSKKRVAPQKVTMTTIRVRSGIKTHPILVPNKLKRHFKPGQLSTTVSNTVMLKQGSVYEVQQEVADWLTNLVPAWFI